MTEPERRQPGGKSADRSTLLRRLLRGCESLVTAAATPLGPLACRGISQFDQPQRRRRGKVFVVPGVDGRNALARGIVLGLADGGVESAIEVFDWTTGVPLLSLYHLRASGRHTREAARLAGRISAYGKEYPGRPIHVVGHSAGAGISVMALETLGEHEPVASAVLLAPALSPEYDLSPALRRVSAGMWSFFSPGDVFILGAGTLIFGSIDGPRTVSAGARGFTAPAAIGEEGEQLYRTRLYERRYRKEMAGALNFGGHIGCTNRLFVEEYVAPLLAASGPYATESYPSAVSKNCGTV